MASKFDNAMADIVSTLRGISEDGGFNTTVALVRERKISFAGAGKFPCLSVVAGRERIKHLPGGFIRRSIRVLITGFVRPPKGIDKRRAARDLMADAQRALLDDPTRGGSAVMTVIRELRYDAMPREQGCRGECAVDIVIHESL